MRTNAPYVNVVTARPVWHEDRAPIKVTRCATASLLIFEGAIYSIAGTESVFLLSIVSRARIPLN